MKEKYRIKAIETRCGIRFDFGKLPDGPAICQKQLLNRVDKLVNTEVNESEIDVYLPAVYEALNGMDKEELIKRLVSDEFSRLFDYYRQADDLNVKPRKAATHRKSIASRQKSRAKTRLQGQKTQRFFINVGRLDKINAGAIVRLICDHSGIRSNMIGEIDLKREFSFFEVQQRVAGKVRQSVKNARLDGRAVKVQAIIEKKDKGHSKQRKHGRHMGAAL